MICCEGRRGKDLTAKIAKAAIAIARRRLQEAVRAGVYERALGAPARPPQNGMAAFAPIPCQPASKCEALCLDWSKDPAAPLLAVSGRGSQIQVFNDEGDKQEPGIDVKRSSDASHIAWHPKNKVLAMGWKDGAVSVWSDTAMPQEDNVIHASPITMLMWSPEGSRLLTGDASGMMGVWKVDKRCRLTPICQYAKQGAITCCAFRNPEARPNSCPDFFFGGENGQVCFANDSGRCSDAFSVSGPIASILYYNKKEAVVVITRNFMLEQYSLQNGPTPALKQTMRVKMSGSANDAHALQCIWAGEGTLATVCNESMVRVWDLEADENYMLSLNDEAIRTKTSSDRITKVMFHAQRGMLAASTKDGLVVFWRFIGSPTDAEDAASAWSPVTVVELNARVEHLAWGPRPSLLAAGFAESATVLLETAFYRKVREGLGCIQSGPDSLTVTRCEPDALPVTLTAGIRISGADHDESRIVVWSGKKAEVYEVQADSCRFVGAFSRVTSLIGIRKESLYAIVGPRVECCNLQGTVKHTIAFTDSEGEPCTLDVMGNFLVVATTLGMIKMWDISRREPRQLGAGTKFAEKDDVLLGNIISVKVNADGSRVSVLSTKNRGNTVVPDTNVYVWFTDLHKIQGYDFGEAGRLPNSHFWDPQEPKLLGCETSPQKKGADGGLKESSSAAEVTTLFVTPEAEVKLQDSFPLEKGYEALMGVQVPSLYFAFKRSDVEAYHADRGGLESTLLARTMRDFSGMEASQMDQETQQALLDFSYFLTIGNMDAAYQAVRLIKTSNVWENMAHMCVKTKRLDVAEVCLGNMGLAKGAQALREASKEPESDARIAMVAIQLGLHEDAERLYMGCGRYDLLNKFYQACGQWERALEVATAHDRIHLRTTHFQYAKHLETMGDFRAAIKHYEASDTHRFEVPRMLFDAQRVADLELYVNQQNDKALFKWWAQYCESNGSYTKALQFYERAEDQLSLVRCHCYKGDLETAKRIAQATGNPAAAYHVARQLEDSQQIQESIEFFSLAGQFNHAVRLAKEQGMNSELMKLALQSAPRTMNEVARHYETRALEKAGNVPLHTADSEVKAMLRNAILLYHKGGMVTTALELCFRSQLHESLRNIADDLGKDSSPELLARCADFFMSHGQHEKAVQLQITAGNIRGALDLCMEKGVNVTEEMAENMTLPKTKDEREAAERVELLLKLALCCEQRGNYQLAAKKYTQAGDKLKAMQALLKSGDTEKIVFFANVARQGKIYILAANYLQSLDWHNDNGEIMKSIITFYTKAKAFESMSSFYESCSQVREDRATPFCHTPNNASGVVVAACKILCSLRTQVSV